MENKLLTLETERTPTMMLSEESEKLASGELHPSGKSVPGGCFTDGKTYLLHENQEGAAPDCGAMNPTRRPEVVGRQDKQKDVGEQFRNRRSPVRPARFALRAKSSKWRTQRRVCE